VPQRSLDRYPSAVAGMQFQDDRHSIMKAIAQADGRHGEVRDE
jgi:hypothetical protein